MKITRIAVLVCTGAVLIGAALVWRGHVSQQGKGVCESCQCQPPPPLPDDPRLAIIAALGRDHWAGEQGAVNGYKRLFTAAGRAELNGFLRDPNDSIALQAAWELNRVVVRRPKPIEYRTDWVLDENHLGMLVQFVGQRLCFQPPDWWRESTVTADAFPGEHHAFLETHEPATEISWSKGFGGIRISDGRKTLSLRKRDVPGDFSSDHDFRIAAHLGESQSFVAFYGLRGYPYTLLCVDPETRRVAWTSDVWACRRSFSSGPPDFGHRVEIQEIGGRVFVFGGECSGMYIESFESKTGRPLLRFCTSYWFNFSEEWRDKKEHNKAMESE